MTAPATPTPLTETPLAWIEDALPYRDHARCADPECLAGGECAGCQDVREVQAALTVTRELVEAALVVRTHCDNPGNDDDGSRWDGCLESLLDAAAAYRAWTPATATGSGDSGGGEE